jgi:hypothetical protein
MPTTRRMLITTAIQKPGPAVASSCNICHYSTTFVKKRNQYVLTVFTRIAFARRVLETEYEALNLTVW